MAVSLAHHPYFVFFCDPSEFFPSVLTLSDKSSKYEAGSGGWDPLAWKEVERVAPGNSGWAFSRMKSRGGAATSGDMGFPYPAWNP